MKRECDLCKRNKEQSWNSCGYIDKSKRRNKPIDFPALKSANLTVDKCPVYYFNTYRYLYDWYNITVASRTDISNLTMAKRIIFREFGNYINIRREYVLKKREE